MRLIKIVVPIARLLRVEPLVVTTAVQAHISDRRCHVSAGTNGATEKRLIDIAESHTLLGEVLQDLFVTPATVPYFNRQRILPEHPNQLIEMLTVLVGVLE